MSNASDTNCGGGGEGRGGGGEGRGRGATGEAVGKHALTILQQHTCTTKKEGNALTTWWWEQRQGDSHCLNCLLPMKRFLLSVFLYRKKLAELPVQVGISPGTNVDGKVPLTVTPHTGG